MRSRSEPDENGGGTAHDGLRERIDHLLRNEERRYIAVLRAEAHATAAAQAGVLESDLATFQTITMTAITERQGCVWQSAHDEVVGVWGTEALPPEPVKAALEAARRIAAAARGLHHTQLRIAIDAGVGTLDRTRRTLIAPMITNVRETCRRSGNGDIAVSETAMEATGKGRMSERDAAALSSDSFARLITAGPDGDLARIASAAGMTIDVDLLSDITATPAIVIEAALIRLQAAGILARNKRDDRPAWTFRDRTAHDAAYASLSFTARSRIHSAIATRLARTHGAPEALALQFERAADRRAAADAWMDAARRAVAAAQPARAIAHMDRAADCMEGADGARRMALAKLRVTQLVQLDGNAARSVLRAIEDAELLSGEIAAPAADRFDVAWMRQTWHIVRGDMGIATRGARDLTRQAAHLGERAQLLATRIEALTTLLTGDVEGAISGYRMVLDRFDAARDADLRLTHVSDQAVLTHAHLAWAHAIGGRPDLSHAHQTRALDGSSHLQHPHTSAHAMAVLASAAQLRGDAAVALTLSAATIEYADHHGFAYWGPWARLVRGWHTSIDDAAGGAVDIAEALRAYRATGAEQATPYGLTLLAQALDRAGCQHDARRAARAALETIAQTGLELFRPAAERTALTLGTHTRGALCRIDEREQPELHAEDQAQRRGKRRQVPGFRAVHRNQHGSCKTV